MRVNIKNTNLTMTEAIGDYLDQKLADIKKLVIWKDEEVMIDIELARTTRHHQSGDIFKAEINIFAPGETFRAVSETQDLYSSIDDMKDQIMNELRINKKKRLHLVRKTGQKIKDFIRKFYK